MSHVDINDTKSESKFDPSAIENFNSQTYQPEIEGNVSNFAPINDSVFEAAQDDRFSTNLHLHHILSNSGSRAKPENEIANKFRKSDYSARPSKKVSYQPQLEPMIEKTKNKKALPKNQMSRARWCGWVYLFTIRFL